MRKIIRDGAIAEDHWQHVADDAALPAGDIIVGFARWQQERDALLRHDGRVGIRIDGDTSLLDIVDDLEHFALIALNFPAFKDGRCYSHARVLRERFRYGGELRAVGDVLRDQLMYMSRVGINAFEVREDRSIADALNAFKEFSGYYQINPHGPIARDTRRQQRRAAVAAG
ncbi:DUF934 domain-containing protein [Aquisalimonas sp.]|uniref:DUF934 domain-containing protein n=1 Tax=unclassified Aquisalimonas TaxID=2644645 RepID=UPI0025B8B86D|nr:DUF934 domain-containing protein [Aquisalimonas sp.]